MVTGKIILLYKLSCRGLVFDLHGLGYLLFPHELSSAWNPDTRCKLHKCSTLDTKVQLAPSLNCWIFLTLKHNFLRVLFSTLSPYIRCLQISPLNNLLNPSNSIWSLSDEPMDTYLWINTFFCCFLILKAFVLIINPWIIKCSLDALYIWWNSVLLLFFSCFFLLHMINFSINFMVFIIAQTNGGLNSYISYIHKIFFFSYIIRFYNLSISLIDLQICK